MFTSSDVNYVPGVVYQQRSSPSQSGTRPRQKNIFSQSVRGLSLDVLISPLILWANFKLHNFLHTLYQHQFSCSTIWVTYYVLFCFIAYLRCGQPFTNYAE